VAHPFDVVTPRRTIGKCSEQQLDLPDGWFTKDGNM